MTKMESSSRIKKERLIQETRINQHNGHNIQFPRYFLELQVSLYL